MRARLVSSGWPILGVVVRPTRDEHVAHLGLVKPQPQPHPPTSVVEIVHEGATVSHSATRRSTGIVVLRERDVVDPTSASSSVRISPSMKKGAPTPWLVFPRFPGSLVRAVSLASVVAGDVAVEIKEVVVTDFNRFGRGWVSLAIEHRARAHARAHGGERGKGSRIGGNERARHHSEGYLG